MKGLRLSVILTLVLSAPFLFAKAEPDFFFTNYTPTEIWFLNQHYHEIENGRMIRVDGIYQGHQWKKPFAYYERMKAIGRDFSEFNVLQISLREWEGVRYAFPILLVSAAKGTLSELDSLKKGQRVALYGYFFNLKDSEYSLELHVLETVDKGGSQSRVLLDSRMPPTPTPTVTPTPTPAPSLWKRVQKWTRIKQTPEPTGTVTPVAVPSPAE